jgi:hypothetical protein
MHIQVVRRGGIAGVTLRGEADSAELAGADGRAEELLRSLPAGRPSSPGRPDRFRYEITVTDGGRSRTAHFGEDELPESLRPLVKAALAHGTVD